MPEEIICTYLQTWGETTIANEFRTYVKALLVVQISEFFVKNTLYMAALRKSCELIDYMNKKNNETTTKKILHTSDKCSIYL